MTAARRVEGEHVALRDKLEEIVRETLRPHLAVGQKTSTQMLETVTEAIVDVLRSQFVVGTRRPRPRRETERALSLRLPPIGAAWEFKRRGRIYQLRVVSEMAIEVEVDGEASRYESLKAAAVSIIGYTPSVSGWRFFFGSMSHDEVSARYYKKD